ncbi:carbohydrate binding domain-containing protein [bacterium]|nr:carbohydrate binding domain-containing protein [bacterium]
MRVLLSVWWLTLGAVCSAAPLPFADVTLPTRNYVNNGGFERGLEGWEAFGGRTFGALVTDERHSGQACFKVTGSLDDYRYLNQGRVLLTPGKTYVLSAWTKAAGFKRAGDNSLFLNLTNYGWTQSAQVGPAKPDEDWTRHEVTFQAPPTAEQGGRPWYTLTVFWPIQCEGTVWVDDIQIEAAERATDFTDSYVGWGMQALEHLRRARLGAEGLRRNLTEGPMQSPPALTERVAQALQRTDELAGRLRQYASLTTAQTQSLLQDTETLAGDISSLSSLVFLANPYLPPAEVALPTEQPAELAWAATCLQGEHRATALTVANLGTEGETMRLVAGELWDETRQVRLVGTPWLTMFTAPPLRGLVKPWQRLTDPLVRLAEGGVWPVLPGEMNQAVLVCDTGALLPGSYRGEVELQSLTREAPPRRVAVRLTVVPVALAPLSGVAVCDIGAMADYALDSIGPLGVNTFTVPAQWLAPEVDDAGKATVDFTRVAPLVRARLECCPEGRFWLGFGVGHTVAAHLQKAYGIGLDDPRFAPVFSAWVKAVVAGFSEMGLPPERLVFETVDEPSEGQLAEATTIARAIKAAEPKVLTQTYVTSLRTTDAAARAMYQAHDIIAPGFTCLNAEALAPLRQMGKQVWVYDCQSNAETFHPVTYCRLLPWMARRWGLEGWGHFSMLDSARGRHYEPWQGVAEESLVYPGDSGGQVISRRWLALQAGTEDTRALASLARLGGVQAPALQAQARKLLTDAPAQALSLAKPGRDYFTGLQPGADAGVLDRFREQAATLAGELAAAASAGARFTLTAGPGQGGVAIDAPQGGAVTLRILCDRQLPWRTVQRTVPEGRSVIETPVPTGQQITRCLAQLVGESGAIYTECVPPLVHATTDSVLAPYSVEKLNDGLAMPGMKFEPEWGWMSGGAGAEHWVEARLDRPVAVRGARVWWMTFYGLPQAVKLQVWREGAWTDAPGYEQWRAAKAAVEELTMPTVTTDRVRVVQKAGGGNRAFPNLMGMSEIEILEGRGR